MIRMATTLFLEKNSFQKFRLLKAIKMKRKNSIMRTKGKKLKMKKQMIKTVSKFLNKIKTKKILRITERKKRMQDN